MKMKYKYIILMLLFLALLPISARGQMGAPPVGFVHVGPPHFMGVVEIYSSPTVEAHNWYGSYRLDVDLAGIVALLNEDNVIYTSKLGNDADGGTTPYEAKLTIQAAITQAIADGAAINNRFAVYVYPGVYAEALVMGDYVDLIGLGAIDAVEITGVNENALITMSATSNRIYNVGIHMAPTAVNATAIEILSGMHMFQDVLIDITSATNGIECRAMNMDDGALLMDNCRINYDLSGSAAGALTHQVFDIAGTSELSIRDCNMEITVEDIDDIVIGFYEVAGSTITETFFFNNNFRMHLDNAAYTGTCGMFYAHGNGLDKHYSANYVRVSSDGDGDGYCYYMNTVTGGQIYSLANEVLVEGFAVSGYADVAAGDILNSHFDDITLIAPAIDLAGGAGVYNMVTSAAGGELFINGQLQLQDGTEGVNEVLTSDAAGVGTWVLPAVQTSTMLDGTVHTDTVAQVVTRGSIIYGDATPDWNELVIGANTFVLTSDGTDISWQAPGIAGNHAILDGAVHNDSVADAVTRGSLIYGNSTPNWDELVIGGAGNVLTSDGTDVSWQVPGIAGNHAILDGAVHTDSVADAVTRGSIIYGNSTPNWDELVIGAAGTVLGSDGTDVSWGAPTVRLDQVTSPNANTLWAMTTNQLRLLFTNPAVADGGLEIEASGAFSGDLVHIHQHTGNPGAVELLHLECDDVDVLPLRVEAANNTITSIYTIGPIRMTDGNEGVGQIIVDDGAGTGVMEWAAPVAKVKVDAAATSDYIGAAANDGVLRVNVTNGLTWTDGGDFITIAFDADYGDISGNDGATGVTGAELETLSDGSDADALHTHNKLKIVNKAITIEDPANDEDITLWFTDDAITINQLAAVLIGDTGQSVTYTVRFAADRSAAGTEVDIGGDACTSVTTGDIIAAGWDDETIPADMWIWLETTAKAGNVSLFNLTIRYTVD